MHVAGPSIFSQSDACYRSISNCTADWLRRSAARKRVILHEFQRTLAQAARRKLLGLDVYHLLVADAVSIQRPTKYRIVHEYLSGYLGRIADIGCGPGVFLRYICARATDVFAADIDEASLARVRGQASRQHRIFAALLPL